MSAAMSRPGSVGGSGCRGDAHARSLSAPAALLSAILLTGCSTIGPESPRVPNGTITVPVAPNRAVTAEASIREADRLNSDRRCLERFSTQLVRIAAEMEELKQTVKVSERGHFTSDEHDRIEGLLFRYLTCRRSLWDMVESYADYQQRFTSPDRQVRAFLIGFNAAVQLTSYSSLLVASFMDNPGIVAKLNEDYHRLGIPAGTYDTISASVTAVDNLERLRTAWQLFSSEMTAPRSALREIIAADTVYRKNVDEICTLYAEADARTQEILERKSLLLPDVANRLRQTMIADLARQAREQADSNLAAAQGVLFLNVSRLKDPLTKPTHFTAEQIREMRSLFRPGDIVLTYSAGYMSNVFLPGVFKHGITYVGSPRQRKTLGLQSHRLRDKSEKRRRAFLDRVETERLPAGHPAELVEAVAEGVIFNSLEAILDGHVSRMVILRPRFTPAEFREMLGTIFEFLGDEYDFDFDFSDASAQCCTEVIYRAVNGLGACKLDLVQRLGRPTLAADDIIHQYVAKPGDAFAFVMLAEQDAAAEDGRASLLTGIKGEDRLRDLMAEGMGKP